ncbi:MAG: hypothetical protein HY553_02415 [Elusimicrobia bacterium]|nr:hypothetical protein [Elusimicrobiota bacterium]
MSGPAFRTIPVSGIRYSPEEFRQIQGGHRAQDMDDKWALVWRDGALDIARSWTGSVVLRCRFDTRGDGTYLARVEVVDEGMARHETADVAAAWFLIGWRILGALNWDDVPGALPDGAEDAAGPLFSGWARLLRQKIDGFPVVPVEAVDQLAYFRDLQGRHRDSLSIAWRLASLYRRLGRDGEAESVLERLIREPWSSRTSWALAELASLRQDGGCLADALRGAAEGQDLTELIDAVHERLRAQAGAAPGEHAARVLGVLSREEPELILDSLRKSAGSGPDALGMGLLHLCAGAGEKAAASFDLGLRERPGDHDLLKLRAAARFLQGKLDEARCDAAAAKGRLPIVPLCDFILER